MADPPSAPSAPAPPQQHVPPASGPAGAARKRMSEEALQQMQKEELLRLYKEQERYIASLEDKQANHAVQEAELASLREPEEKLRQQQLEATRRENVLVMRLTTKEQEMQDYANQINELKAAQAPGAQALRSSLLDPAVNLMMQRMKKEVDDSKAKMEETQNELSAWKFTPDSNTGKRLMAKCRLLYQENEELGKMISSGRLAKLEGDLALQKNFSEEMKKSQSELDEFIQELDEDVEGMQSTIYYLQQQLRESKELISHLQGENETLKKAMNSASLQDKQVENSVSAPPSPLTPAPEPTPPVEVRTNHEPSVVKEEVEEDTAENGIKEEPLEVEEMAVEEEEEEERTETVKEEDGVNGNHRSCDTVDRTTDEGEATLKRTHDSSEEGEGEEDSNDLVREAKRPRQDEDSSSRRLVVANGTANSDNADDNGEAQ